MAARSPLVLVVFGALASLGASYRTTNFVVEAPTPQIAQQVGQYAEYYRREKALQWLGQEMPPWPEPCPLRVTVTMNGSGGATSFAFDRGQILGQDMHIEGSLDRLLASVLPHEVTHTVFAHYYRCPVPRWADEGGAVLSEDDVERNRHDALVRQILNTPGRAIPLRRLFSLTKYPPDVMVLYAEGYSVSNFLVAQGGRTEFLAFVAQGMRGDWDAAAQAHYRYNSVEELEKAWVEDLSRKRQQPEATTQVVSRGPGGGDAPGQVVTRTTAPPVQPLLEAPRPVARGQNPDADWPDLSARPAGPQNWLPEAKPQPAPPPPPVAPPAGAILPPPPSSVRLGAPQGDPAAPPTPPAQARLGPPMGMGQ
jgi:hypothetical protein